MLEEADLKALIGRDVEDRDGKSIGYLEHVFSNAETGVPEWAGVLAGTFRQHHVLVPLEGAEKAGGSLRVAYAKDQVKDAPRYDKEEPASVGGTERVRISAAMDREARAHYGLDVPVGAGSA